jgi:hypothetical protein
MKPQIKREFFPRKGAQFGKEKAELYGGFIWGLRDQGLSLTPKEIVSKAKSKNSPIHDFFDWENDSAADKYRLHQARLLLNMIEVKVVFEKGEKNVAAFENISVELSNDDDGKERKYVTIQDIQDSPKYLEAVMKSATEEILYWKDKYEIYEKFKQFKRIKPIISAVRRLEAQA